MREFADTLHDMDNNHLPAGGNIAIFPGNTGADTRVFSENALPPGFPAASAAKILTKIDKTARKEEKRLECQKTKARKLACGLLGKKKTLQVIYGELSAANIPLNPVVIGLIRIASGFNPGQPVTGKQILDMAGDKPDEITKKWWEEKLPELLDTIRFTEKVSQTERRFVDLADLKVHCSLVSNAVHQCTYWPGHFVLTVCERTARTLVTKDPYLEHKKNGELIIYEKPEQTPEGMAAKREADRAKYLAKQRAVQKKYEAQMRDDDEAGHSDYQDVIESYKTPALVIAGITALLVGWTAMQPEQHNPNLLIEEQQAHFGQAVSSEDIAAQVGGYIEEGVDE